MNNPTGHEYSRKCDEAIVEYLMQMNTPARISTPREDKLYKIDIVITGKAGKQLNVDTKYSKKSSDELWFEYIKHGADSISRAEYIWYFLNDDWTATYLVKRSSLIRLSLDGRKTRTPRTDPLIDFSITELTKGKDYWVKDMSVVKRIFGL